LAPACLKAHARLRFPSPLLVFPIPVLQALNTTIRALLQAAALVVLAGMAAGSADDSLRPVRIRVQWGGGTPRGWTGQITIVHPEGAPGPVQPWPVDWQTLCLEPDAAALAHGTPDGIAIHEPRPVASDGIEITIHDWPRARLRVQLGPTATIDPEQVCLAIKQDLINDGVEFLFHTK